MINMVKAFDFSERIQSGVYGVEEGMRFRFAKHPVGAGCFRDILSIAWQPKGRESVVGSLPSTFEVMPKLPGTLQSVTDKA